MAKKSLLNSEMESMEEPVINLTPLIDVVFVVLISFMLIAPMLDVDVVELAQGGSTQKKEVVNRLLSIQIRADQSIWVRGKKIQLKDLESILKEEKKQSPESLPQLIPDKKADFGTYQAVKNRVESCGFAQMEIVLKPS